jgi:hypothetical protein
MPVLHRLDLPTGMTMTLGCRWPTGNAEADQAGAAGQAAAREGKQDSSFSEEKEAKRLHSFARGSASFP